MKFFEDKVIIVTGASSGIGKVTAIRFSESGDFKNQDAVNKLSNAFKMIKEVYPNIAIYGYTARRDLSFTELKKYATVQGSGFIVSNSFKAVETIDNSKPKCAMDCKKCNLCLFPLGIEIQVKKH